MSDAKVAFGESIVTEIDQGIGSSRCGTCFVTPSYIDLDRFWPREELAVLIMGRKRVIPVFSGLGFGEVERFSARLGGRKGISVDAHGLDEIAELLVAGLRGGALTKTRSRKGGDGLPWRYCLDIQVSSCRSSTNDWVQTLVVGIPRLDAARPSGRL